jgi:hypothetical protein
MKLSLLAGTALAVAAFSSSLEGCSARIASHGDAPVDAIEGVPTATQDAGPPTDPGGTLSLQLVLPEGQEFATIQWRLDDTAGTHHVSGSASAGATNAAEFPIQNLAPDTYTLTVSATTTSGVSCSGSAGPWVVEPGTWNREAVTLTCMLGVPPPDAGCCPPPSSPSDWCGVWESLDRTGQSAYVGDSVTFIATATGPKPALLQYAWTVADPGVAHLVANTAKGELDTASFQCDAPGSTGVTLVVSESYAPPDVCDAYSLSTVTDTVWCNAVPGSGGADAAADAAAGD